MCLWISFHFLLVSISFFYFLLCVCSLEILHKRRSEIPIKRFLDIGEGEGFWSKELYLTSPSLDLTWLPSIPSGAVWPLRIWRSPTNVTVIIKWNVTRHIMKQVRGSVMELQHLVHVDWVSTERAASAVIMEYSYMVSGEQPGALQGSPGFFSSYFDDLQ